LAKPLFRDVGAALGTIFVFNKLQAKASDMPSTIARATSDHFGGRASSMLSNAASSGVSPGTEHMTSLIERAGAFGRRQSAMVLDRSREHSSCSVRSWRPLIRRSAVNLRFVRSETRPDPLRFRILTAEFLTSVAHAHHRFQMRRHLEQSGY